MVKLGNVQFTFEPEPDEYYIRLGPEPDNHFNYETQGLRQKLQNKKVVLFYSHYHKFAIIFLRLVSKSTYIYHISRKKNGQIIGNITNNLKNRMLN